jgi:hypothetical protein
MEFRTEVDTVDITSNVPEADPEWSFTDGHGHEHRWQNYEIKGGLWVEGAELPTLRWVVDEEWVDEDGDDREEGHYECIECGDKVTPGRRMPPAVCRTIPGMRHFYIDGEEVDEETFRRKLSEAEAAQT